MRQNRLFDNSAEPPLFLITFLITFLVTELAEHWADLHAAGFLATLEEERRAQIGVWRVYDSEKFVRNTALELGWCFKAKSIGVRGIVGLPPEAGAMVLGYCIAGRDEKNVA